MKKIGVYIHIPFCKSKCFYCDFVSYSFKNECIEKYIKALKKEIIETLGNIKEEINIDTIYLGGGTPSYIDSKYIYEILQIPELKSKIMENCEITIEINPGTINREKLIDYKNAGINRISMGLQSTNNEILKAIGRIHTYEQFLDSYNLVREAGFQNINVDLMLALPNQTIEILEESVQKVIDINPEHISIYSLILEEDTKLYNMVNLNKTKLPSEEQEREMYWKVKELLEKYDYKHYEISNFSKTGFESKHNCNCWKQNEYLGFGTAAHSYYNSIRYSNITEVEKYIENINKDLMQNNIIVNEEQSINDKQKEFVMMGLRRIEGIRLEDFCEKFNMRLEKVFEKEIELLKKQGLIEVDTYNIKLSNLGIDLANLVWEKFV